MTIGKFGDAPKQERTQEQKREELAEALRSKGANVGVNDDTHIVDDHITAGNIKDAMSNHPDDTPVLVALGIPGTEALAYFDVVAVSKFFDAKTGQDVVVISVLPEGMI